MKDIITRLFFAFLAVYCLLIFVPYASAACVIQGYVKDNNGNPIESNISSQCIKEGSQRNIFRIAGEPYYLSWGGPFDTCLDYCEEVRITVKEVTFNLINLTNWSTTYNNNYDLNINTTIPEPPEPPVEPPEEHHGGGTQKKTNTTSNTTKTTNQTITKPIIQENKTVEQPIIQENTTKNESQPLNNSTTSENKQPGISILTIIAIALVIGVIGFIAYKLWREHEG